MKLRTALSMIVLLGFSSLVSAADNPRCLAKYKAEEARITRDAERSAAANPPGDDIKAQQHMMTRVHEALKAASERVEKCNRESQSGAGSPNSTAANRQMQCVDTANQQIADLHQRYAGRPTLSRNEQMTLRDEENRIVEARMDCMRKVR